MRLIGGNISDQAIKRISTGSAFHVGGGATVPSLITLGTPTTPADFSNLKSPSAGPNLRGYSDTQWDYIKWDDNSVGVFWLDYDDSYKLKYVHLQFNSSTGALSSEGSTQDQSSDLTGDSSSSIIVDKVSSTRCLVWYMKASSTTAIHLITYDKNSDALTKHGSVQTINTTQNSVDSFRGFATAVLDADHAVAFTKRSSGHREGVIFKFTTTQSIGSFTSSGVAGTTEMCWGIASYDSDSGKIFDTDGYALILEWTYSGTTLTYGATLFTTRIGGGTGYYAINGQFRHDIEAGRLLHGASANIMNSSDYSNWIFRGRTNKDGQKLYANPFGQNTLVYSPYHARRHPIPVSYNEDTKWEQYILIARGNTASSYDQLCVFPFNFNWNVEDNGASITGPNNDQDLFVSDWSCAAAADSLGFLTGTGGKALFVIGSDNPAGSAARYTSIPLTYSN
jgi:hypothetical protein